MTTVANFRAGPWVPVKVSFGDRAFWVVQNRLGQKPIEDEENARIIATALNAAMNAENSPHLAAGVDQVDHETEMDWGDSTPIAST